jgi:DNA-binding transcriptional regulator YhcF (GntR family)
VKGAQSGGGRDEKRDEKRLRVSAELRARIADGIYPVGALLPPQRELARELGVARDTVQRALRDLKDEGWIESRQGSGSKVIKTQRIQSTTAKGTRSHRPVTLGPLISEAFEQGEVTLDVYTLTSESLDTHIRLQSERIRAGAIAPRRITLRMLLPSEELKLPYPRAIADPGSPRLRDRLRGITQRHTESLLGVLNELATEGLVPSVSVQIRRAPLIPTFKLYLLNGVEVLHGPYEVIERTILDGDEVIQALDVLGLGATLTHFVKDGRPQSQSSVFVDSWQSWFDSVWDRLAE